MSKIVAQAKSRKLTKAPRPVRKPTPPSSSSDDGDDSEDDDRAVLLAALQAQNRRMLGLDGPDEAESSAQALRRASSEGSLEGGEEVGDEDDDGDESEDTGFGTDEAEDEEDDGWNGIQVDVPDGTSNGNKVQEVVFTSSASGGAASLSKADRRAFMHGSSRKIMGLAKETDYAPRPAKRKHDEGEDAEDNNNMQLDRTLHSMLLNSLISTSAAETAARPSEKRKAVSARLLELAQYSLPGEGSKHASLSDLSRHPAKVRTGLVKAQEAKADKRRAEAQAAEGWVRGPKVGGGKQGRDGKRLGLGMEVGKKKGMEKLGKERGRGLGMGVGRYEGGMLKLSESEIRRGNGESGGRGGKRGRGSKRGRR